MMLEVLALAVWLAAGGIEPPAAAEAPLILAQRKPYDRGNCFQWKGCRGDSIGAMWVRDPDICKALGGKSWLDGYGRCHSLPDGAQVVTIPR